MVDMTYQNGKGSTISKVSQLVFGHLLMLAEPPNTAFLQTSGRDN